MIDFVYHLIASLIVDSLKNIYPSNDSKRKYSGYSINNWDNASSLIKLLDMDSRGFEEVLQQCQENLSIARRSGDQLFEASALVNLGVAYKRQMNSKEALRYYQIALDIARHENNKALQVEIEYFISELNYEEEISKLSAQ